LNDQGIGAILNVKYQRERVPVPPIYFLSPNMASIEKVVKDYENSKKTTVREIRALVYMLKYLRGLFEAHKD